MATDRMIVPLAATTTVEIARHPFTPGAPSKVTSVPGGTLYSAKLPAKVGTPVASAKYARFEGDGSTTAFTSNTYAALANAHVDGGSLAAADTLRVVVKVNGAVLQRVAASASPTSGQFKTSGSSPTTLTFGAAPNALATIEVFMLAAADINSQTVTANVPAEVTNTGEVFLASAAMQMHGITG